MQERRSAEQPPFTADSVPQEQRAPKKEARSRQPQRRNRLRTGA